jgi:hypothetical protein
LTAERLQGNIMAQECESSPRMINHVYVQLHRPS